MFSSPPTMEQAFHSDTSTASVFSRRCSHSRATKVRELEAKDCPASARTLCPSRCASGWRNPRRWQSWSVDTLLLACVEEGEEFLFFVAPKGIVGTCVCSAVIGLIYLLALLFAIPDVSTFVENNSGDNQTINLAVATYQLAVPPRGAMGLTILLIVNLYFAGMSSLTVTSRIGYSVIDQWFEHDLSLLQFRHGSRWCLSWLTVLTLDLQRNENPTGECDLCFLHRLPSSSPTISFVNCLHRHPRHCDTWLSAVVLHAYSLPLHSGTQDLSTRWIQSRPIRCAHRHHLIDLASHHVHVHVFSR